MQGSTGHDPRRRVALHRKHRGLHLTQTVTNGEGDCYRRGSATLASVADEERVTISVKASDDLAGIDKVVAFISNPNGDGERGVSALTLDSATK